MGKHGPNRLSNYESVHTQCIRHRIDGGFLLRDELSWEATGGGFITGDGTLVCLGEIRLEVTKRLKIRSGEGANAIVQTVSYSYNAVLGNVGNIVRYDSPHAHRPFHHVHRFDVLNGDQEGTCDDIHDENKIPTISEVLDELTDFYYGNIDPIEKLRQTGR